MSAGNTLKEARTQALSEIFERHIKFRIIAEGLCLPDVPEAVIDRYPHIAAGIRGLREAGFGILVKDASLGGQYPVMNVTLLHPDDQGCFASFGAHPRFEVALERALTELLQGRALDSLAGFPAPGFDRSRNRRPAEPGNPLRRFQRRDFLAVPARHPRLRIRRLEFRHHHRRGLRVVGRCAARSRARPLHRRLHPPRRLRLPHPGARRLRDLSGRGTRIREQQRRQPDPPGARAPA